MIVCRDSNNNQKVNYVCDWVIDSRGSHSETHRGLTCNAESHCCPKALAEAKKQARCPANCKPIVEVGIRTEPDCYYSAPGNMIDEFCDVDYFYRCPTKSDTPPR